jgi:hypothetical protein
MRRPYITETAVKPGTGVVQGSAENKVKSPGANGAGTGKNWANAMAASE